MIYIIKIIKSVKDSGVLIDGVIERVKHEIKNKKVDFKELQYVQPVISSVVKGISGRGVRRAGKGYMGKQF